MTRSSLFGFRPEVAFIVFVVLYRTQVETQEPKAESKMSVPLVEHFVPQGELIVTFWKGTVKQSFKQEGENT